MPTLLLCYKTMSLCISDLRMISDILKGSAFVEENGFPILLYRFHQFRYLEHRKSPESCDKRPGHSVSRRLLDLIGLQTTDDVNFLTLSVHKLGLWN
jgi:hypothetical protein